jgi:5-methylcytosine-specific restriction endonuclease McrA
MRIDYICAVCGKSGKRYYTQGKVPSVFFCSVPCQNEWQKTREDIVAKNKDPEFRKKVSDGLKHRKKVLGNNYHSEDAKRRIGKATSERWNKYPEETRQHFRDILKTNAENSKVESAYDSNWRKISEKLRSESCCQRCGKSDGLIVHHIIPVKSGGSRERNNLAVLCVGCHSKTEWATKKIYEIVKDWGIVQLLVRERLQIAEQNYRLLITGGYVLP